MFEYQWDSDSTFEVSLPFMVIRFLEDLPTPTPREYKQLKRRHEELESEHEQLKRKVQRLEAVLDQLLADRQQPPL